jgi:DsbC/DsbD-like thiol-disulfide interchange protein
MRYGPLFTALAVVLGLVPSAALAGAGPWVEVAPDTRIRLISSDRLKADGTTLIGLEADMPAGTRTYWRTPGESGIPTQLDLSGSTGLTGASVLWPYPSVDTSQGVVDYVYFGRTVLPASVHAGPGAVVKANVLMGICTDICVPARAELTLPLDFSGPDAAETVRLRQAVAQVPLPWDGEADAIGPVRYDEAANALSIAVRDPSIDPMSLLAEAPGHDPIFGVPQKNPDGRSILLPLLGTTHEKGLEGQPIHLTFMTSRGPYETVRKVAADQ